MLSLIRLIVFNLEQLISRWTVWKESLWRPDGKECISVRSSSGCWHLSSVWSAHWRPSLCSRRSQSRAYRVSVWLFQQSLTSLSTFCLAVWTAQPGSLLSGLWGSYRWCEPHPRGKQCPTKQVSFYCNACVSDTTIFLEKLGFQLNFVTLNCWLEYAFDVHHTGFSKFLMQVCHVHMLHLHFVLHVIQTIFGRFRLLAYYHRLRSQRLCDSLSVCLSVSWIIQKVMNGFWWYFWGVLVMAQWGMVRFWQRSGVFCGFDLYDNPWFFTLANTAWRDTAVQVMNVRISLKFYQCVESGPRTNH